MRELPVPPDAKSDKEALEVFRGWIVGGKLQCSLAPWVWKDTPEVWGMLVADVVHHLSRALEHETGMSRGQIFRIITKKLNEELQDPSSDHPGDFLK